MAASEKPKPVDKLTITFLVDNSIEWLLSLIIVTRNIVLIIHMGFIRMTKFPPGFIQEVPLHLMDPDVPKDPLTGVPILDFENFCCG